MDQLQMQSNERLIEDLNNLYDCSSALKYADFVLIVEKKKLPVHKIILSARSPVFAAMFENDMVEGRQGSVVINDVRYECMQELIRFIYTGKLRHLDIMATEILSAANKVS